MRRFAIRIAGRVLLAALCLPASAGYRYVVIFSDFRGFNTLRESSVLTHVNSVYGALGIGF